VPGVPGRRMCPWDAMEASAAGSGGRRDRSARARVSASAGLECV